MTGKIGLTIWLLLLMFAACGILAAVFWELAVYGTPGWIHEPSPVIAWIEFGMYCFAGLVTIIALVMLFRSMGPGGGSCILCGGPLKKVFKAGQHEGKS